MEPEIWLPIKDYVGRYEVSNAGAVRSVVGRQASLLKQATTPHGTRVVKLYKNGFGTTFRVHVLVWRAFHPVSTGSVYHVSSDHADNRLSNLTTGATNESRNVGVSE